MRIVIDMQGAQTESRFRGIGRYTLGFVHGVIRNCGEHEVILALSGMLPDAIESIRATFEDLLPPQNIRVWYAPGPVAETHGDNAWREAAELVREAFLMSLKPDVVHVCSLFEGYVDDAVTSIGQLDPSTPVTVTLHDLIPLRNPTQYLEPNPRYSAYYSRKLGYLGKAARLLANSEATRQESIEYLDVVPEHVVNVSSGIESSFSSEQVSVADMAHLQEKFGLEKSVVLYTGGDDDRKNLPRLVSAYAALPKALRQGRQLVMAGKMQPHNIAEFKRLGREQGLTPQELVFTGYVSDEELIQLYRMCTLFVFPSWHEGFGLPALEAMACGAPVIGANTSSLPEVIGLDEALFDPFQVEAISAKIAQALESEAFRGTLREHGLQRTQLFSWDESGRRAVAAWEQIQTERRQVVAQAQERKPRLALVSPFPPERTGIADYSAELLPSLAQHYEIDIVVAQERVDDACVQPYANVRDVAWLKAHAKEIDRVVYQIGNSPFHHHMLSLLREVPGTVVLHDFFLSGLVSWLELSGTVPGAWSEALYADHGYEALVERLREPEAAKRNWPVNLDVLRDAKGLIFHSRYARDMVTQWYGTDFAVEFRVIPHLRISLQHDDRTAIRSQLGIRSDAFVVCSFGFLDATKQSERLLKVWLASALAADARCELVFVGENHGGDYGQQVLQTLRASGLDKRVKITGYAPTQMYQQYLAAADMAVQLRTHSRGETSGAVLDCMNHGLPLVVNANGSLGEVERDAVWMLPDEFTDAELARALETLWRTPEQRDALGARGREVIRTQHAPAWCAQQYAEAIEHFHATVVPPQPLLLDAVARTCSLDASEPNLQKLAAAIALTLPPLQPRKRILVDISATHRTDLKTGIERVARALLLALLKAPPEACRIEPVYLSDRNGTWHYRTARGYTLNLMGMSEMSLPDDVIEPDCGDIIIGLDLVGDTLVHAVQSGRFARYRDRGVKVYFLVHDLLPILMPDVFPPGADEGHRRWLEAIMPFDGAVCVSRAVAQELTDWRQAHLANAERRPFHITWSHHGADVGNSAPSRGLPDDATRTLEQLKRRPTFLMVGTIEPRKGYLEVIQAFEHLWKEQVDVNLLIVGKEGWVGLPDAMRCDIPETLARLIGHPERDRRLFWPQDVSDEYLESLYSSASCLIAASYGEGFGLPLIEAARHGLPILARDIPVFREVAGEHACYFSSANPSELAVQVKKWLALHAQNQAPASIGMPFLTWEQSAANLARCLLEG